MNPRRFAFPIAALIAAVAFIMSLPATRADNPSVVYDGFDGPGKGKHIVLVAGDDPAAR